MVLRGARAGAVALALQLLLAPVAWASPALAPAQDCEPDARALAPPCGEPCNNNDFVCCMVKVMLTIVRVLLGAPPCDLCS